MTTGGRRPAINLTIDEVVVRGAPPEQARPVLAYLEARLTELATEWSRAPEPLHDRAESSRRLPTIDAPAGAAGALGTAVADAVWSEVCGAPSPNRSRR